MGVRSVALVLLALSGGCSEFGIGDLSDISVLDPDILVEPTSLVFEPLRAGQERTQTFVIRNVGAEALRVRGVTIDDGPAFTIAEDPGEFRLNPGDETEVGVVFRPLQQGDNTGRVLVGSNDPETPEVVVDLMGTGNVPDLVIEPAELDFGQSFVPCGSEAELTLRNVGAETLIISDATYTATGSFTVPIRELQDSLPMTLEPGETHTVPVTWVPAVAGTDTGMLEITSNDPAGTEQAYQTGEGTYGSRTQDSFGAPSEPAVDVMFLIDQSCSMAQDNFATLNAGLDDFFFRLTTLSDWQLVQITQESACSNIGVIDSQTAYARDLFADNAFGWNTPESVSEALLNLTGDALEETKPGGCNEGALRDGAMLHVIIASDEPEQSNVAWQSYVTEFQNYVADPALLRISGVVDLEPKGRRCAQGSRTGPDGYREAAVATDGMLVNICQNDWGQRLTDLAAQGVVGLQTYQLSQPAVPGSIIVRVNGVETQGFTYGETTQSVTITSPQVQDGDVVEVDYGLLAVCAE